MSLYAAPVEVCNSALAEFGETQITSLLDGTPAAITLNARYEPIVRAELSKHAYSFAEKVARLSYQGETGDSPKYAYYLPGDILIPRFIMVGSSRVRGAVLRSNKLMVDYQNNYDLHYNYRAPEDEWADDFAEGIVKRLLATLIRALPVDYVRARDVDKEATVLLMQARIRDKNSNRKPHATPDPVLVRAWRGMNRYAPA